MIAAPATPTDRHARSGGQGQGMNFVRPEKRIALYLRDGLACAYCGSTIEDGARLTLDHLVAHSHGGDNSTANLVACCFMCNSSRGNRDWREFAGTVANYLDHGVSTEDIISHIETTVQRPIDIKQAKEIIARRGGFTAALHSLK